MCTFLLQNGALWDMKLVRCGIWGNYLIFPTTSTYCGDICHVVSLFHDIWAVIEGPVVIRAARYRRRKHHYSDVIMGAMASQLTRVTIVYSAVYSGADQRKHQSSASLAFVRGIHRWPVNSPHKWPVTRKMFPFDDAIMSCCFFSFFFYTTEI